MNPGSVLADRYLLEERIGQGGMGVVWRATDLILHRRVALKQLILIAEDNEQAERARDRALREGRLAAKLAHRHVVAIHDVRVDNGDVWLVLEYVPAKSLAQILDERGPLDPIETARIGAQVADALAAAHKLGIEHRDVTPGNVLVTDDGTAKLTDFGISHLAGDTRLSQSGMICGTVAYLAPEVARTGKSSPASDVFSLGATLYAAIERVPPFGTADNASDLLNRVGAGITIRPPTATGAFPSLLMRMLEFDPATRLDAATARDMLNTFATQADASGRPSRVMSYLLRSSFARRRVLIGVIALSAVTGGTALTLVSGKALFGGMLASSTMPQPMCATCAPGGQIFPEQAYSHGPGARTFHDPRDLNHGEGDRVPDGQQVQVVCRFFDPNAAESVQPGWSYLIATSPWSRQYYSPANSYLNGDPPEGPNHTTRVDSRVPVC